jgi:hypothetical protein
MRSWTNNLTILAVLAAVLPFGQKTFAEVVYTPVNISVSGTGILKIDLNHDGVTDVSIVFTGKSITCAGARPGSYGTVYALPAASGNGTVVANSNFVLALSSGTRISSSNSFYSGEGLMLKYSSCLLPPHANYGAWQNVSNHYLGIRFLINGHTHYGWARMSVFFGPIIKLTGFAYESVAGTGISAGQTTGP